MTVAVSLINLERTALIALAAVLPLLEAPKNMLWLAYVVLWLANRVRSRGFGGPWDRWDTLIALWIGSGYAVAAFAGIRHGEWGGTNDLLRYGSVLWLMKRSALPDRTLNALFIALAAGTVVALAWGYYGLLVTGQRQTLGLHSVGHVNHSAIYLAIVFGAALMATRAWWRHSGAMLRALGIALLGLFTVSLFVMQSRAALGAAFLAALALLSIYSIRLRHGVRMAALGAALAVGLVLAAQPAVLQKNEALIEQGLFLSYRDGVWRTGLAAWREFPVFGVGMSNYSRYGLPELERWSTARGEAFDKSRYVFSSHGHSLYINTLAERGIVGFLALAAVLVAWGIALARHVPDANAPPGAWACWGGAASAWIVTLTAGLVNTTLHHEHALLSMLLLGGWLSLRAPGSRHGT